MVDHRLLPPRKKRQMTKRERTVQKDKVSFLFTEVSTTIYYNMYFWLGFIFVHQKSLKPTFQNGFWVQNYLLNLCFGVENSQMLFCSQNVGTWNVRISSIQIYNYLRIFFKKNKKYVCKGKPLPTHKYNWKKEKNCPRER